MDFMIQTIEQAIRSHTYGRQVRELEIFVDGDEIVLTGITSTFFCKQMAQVIAKKCLPTGVRLENRIVVSQT